MCFFYLFILLFLLLNMSRMITQWVNNVFFRSDSVPPFNVAKKHAVVLLLTMCPTVPQSVFVN